MLKNRWQALFNPEQFHGWGKSKKYFEGWYYKVINSDESEAYAFIPGIAMDERGNQHSFIQVLDGKRFKSDYHKFEASIFKPSGGKHDVRIGSSRFQTHQIDLDLPNLEGRLNFNNQVPWPSTWYSPGIMGPFSFVPFMQCYHGIVSMDQEIEGSLNISDRELDFTGGRAYLEKDWGSSFPSGYIWMQSNHFSEPGYSMKLSIAKIPWLGSSFVGFISGLWLKDRLIQFTTYNLTKLKRCNVNGNQVSIVLENNKHWLSVEAEKDVSTTLASPIQGFMDGRIEESMTSKFNVSLYDKKSKRTIFEDQGRNVGLEIAGKYEDLLVS